MRTLRITITGAGQTETGWGSQGNWVYTIHDADTDELIHEGWSITSDMNDITGECAERSARYWIKAKMGTAARSVDVPIPDGVGWDWTTEVKAQTPEEPTVRERLEAVERELRPTPRGTVSERLKRLERDSPGGLIA